MAGIKLKLTSSHGTLYRRLGKEHHSPSPGIIVKSYFSNMRPRCSVREIINATSLAGFTGDDCIGRLRSDLNATLLDAKPSLKRHYGSIFRRYTFHQKRGK